MVAGTIAYLSASLAGLLGLDDVGMFTDLISSDFSVTRLLFSGTVGYFRPMPFISYAFDAFVAGPNPAWYHLVNVAIHLLNGVLVYWLMVNLARESERKGYLALTAALIFTLHPLNSEAVMWISARPDLLCTFFSLITLLLTLQARETPRLFSFCCLFIAYLFSLSSKEVSIILLAVVPLYLLCDSKMKGLKTIALVNAPIYIAALLYLFLRNGKKVVVDPGISRFVKSAYVSSQQSHGSNFLDLLASYGFYLKKLVYPFPLNFAIDTIDTSIALVVLSLAVPCAAVLFYRHKISRLPLLLIFAGIILPVFAYASKLPWTPFAERYLYLPMVGFSLLLALLVDKIPKLPRIVPVALVLFLAIPTTYRVSLWADPVAFWNDVVLKSPRFPRSYVCLAAAQIDVRDYDAAERNLTKASAMGVDKAPLWNGFAAVYLAKKDYASYETAMLKLASISPGPVEIYVKLIESFMMIPEREMDRQTIYSKVIGFHLKILEKSPSSYLSYYNVGKLYWVMGDHRNAAYYLRVFVSKAKNDPMQPYAQKILNRINSTASSEFALKVQSRES
jgi:tetratricopeptide (TPR) repeat protein